VAGSERTLERTGGRGSRTIGIGRRTVSLNSVERTNIFFRIFSFFVLWKLMTRGRPDRQLA
jgi:hypothetical protein